MLKRTVIKLSGEALAGNRPPDGSHNFDDPTIDAIAAQLKQVVASGTQVALVVGGGNFWRGRSARADMDVVKADQMGMLATVMNAIYLAEAFKRHQVDAVVTTPIPIGNMTLLYDKETALKLMAGGTVVINAAGLGHPYFSTDTVTALRAAELQADCIMFAKNVDGVYELDPRLHPGAKKYRFLDYAAAISKNLNAADMTALNLAKDARIPSYMFKLNHPESLILACSFPDTGSLQGTYMDTDTKEDFYAATKQAPTK